jgi:hypothetical protein
MWSDAEKGFGVSAWQAMLRAGGGCAASGVLARSRINAPGSGPGAWRRRAAAIMRNRVARKRDDEGNQGWPVGYTDLDGI